MHSDVKRDLLKIEHGETGVFGGVSSIVSNWPRNPDGPAAVAEIEQLENELAFLRGVDLRKLLDRAEARVAEFEGPPTQAQIEAAKSEFRRVIHSDMVHLDFDKAIHAALVASQQAKSSK